MEPLDLTEETSDSYFRDGIRKVDYVLVVTRISAHENSKILNTYIANLQTAGLQFEQCYGVTESVIFIKIHIPDDTLNFISEKYPFWEATMVVNLDKKINRHFKGCMKYFQTPLDFKDSLAGEDTCGRIYFIYEILKHAKYGDRAEQRGVNRLLDRRVLIKAYPLHDGRIQKELWNNDAALNDRTLLAKYWANFDLFYKQQPLDIIKKYYGLEIAFYFAWLGFYLQMLIPMMLLSCIMLMWNLIRYLVVSKPLVDKLCKPSNKVLCGYCVKELKKCFTSRIEENCTSLTVTVTIEYDSYYYSMIMSIWTVFVAVMWKRYQAQLRKRWNLIEVEHQMDERFQYSKSQRCRRKSFITGRVEVYTPLTEKIIKLIITYVFVAIIGGVLCTLLFLNLYLMAYLKIQYLTYATVTNMEMFFDVMTIIIQFIIVRLAWTGLTKLCALLVNFQLHKYQQEHDKSFLFLRYACAFMNQYMMFFYFAFVKGLMYNIPFERTSTYLSYEKCPLSSCMDILLTVLNIVAGLLALGKLIDYVKTLKKKSEPVILPQFEMEYKLDSVNLYHFTVEFIQNMILHGFLVFFATGNFMGSVFAMVITMSRLRLDANNFIHRYQRPVPKILYNVSPWNSILTFITLTSIFLNAIVSMFTSEAYDMNNYENKHGSLEHYFDYRLSEFLKKDLFGPEYEKNDTCFYRDLRYPYSHKYKYNYTREFWSLFQNKIEGIFIFEMVVLVVIVCFKFAIKDDVFTHATADETFFTRQRKKHSEITNAFRVPST